MIAVYDANVLYSAPLRDLLIRLAQAGLVRAKWTDAIHDEWIRNVVQNYPHLSAERLARTRTLMNDAVRDCLVAGYEDLIASLTLPDPDDRHVLAAAIRGAGVIVTYNLADFPAETLARFDIEGSIPTTSWFRFSTWRQARSARPSNGNARAFSTRPGLPPSCSPRSKGWGLPRPSPGSVSLSTCSEQRGHESGGVTSIAAAIAGRDTFSARPLRRIERDREGATIQPQAATVRSRQTPATSETPSRFQVA